MNLIVYTDHNILLFFNENNGKIEYLSENATYQNLFFYYDSLTKKLNNNIGYKFFYLDKKNGFYGNIFDNIEKNSQAEIDGNIVDYTYFLDSVFSKIGNSYQEIKLIFSYNLSDIIKSTTENIIKQRFPNVTIQSSLAELCVKKYLLENRNNEDNSKIFVVESFFEDIFITEILYAQNQTEVVKTTVLPKMAFNPEQYVLAKKIADDIVKLYNPQISSNIDDTIEYIYYKLNNNFAQIINQPKEYVILSTRLPQNNDRFIVKINPAELKISTSNYVHSVVSKISQNTGDNAKLLFVGNLYKNKLIADKIASLHKHYDFLEITDVLNTINKEYVAEDEFSTMFLATDNVKEQSEFEVLATLDIVNLEVGANIKLTTYDATPGKGYATQNLEYVGDNKFVVIDSTRSLKPGDLVQCEETVWHQGIKIVFDVYRANKKYGRFQTRDIQTIEKCKK